MRKTVLLLLFTLTACQHPAPACNKPDMPAGLEQMNPVERASLEEMAVSGAYIAGITCGYTTALNERRWVINIGLP